MLGSMTAAIEIDHLEVIRGGRTILEELSLEVEAGSVTGLLGPSGSGKTTLMRAIVGVQIVKSGGVTVLGLPAGSPPLRARVPLVARTLGAVRPRRLPRDPAPVCDQRRGRLERARRTGPGDRERDAVSLRPGVPRTGSRSYRTARWRNARFRRRMTSSIPWTRGRSSSCSARAPSGRRCWLPLPGAFDSVKPSRGCGRRDSNPQGP